MGLPNYMKRSQLIQELAHPTVKSYEIDGDFIGKDMSKDILLTDKFPLTTLNSVEGIPYQFMENVDRRIVSAGQSFGRKYSQKILSQLPLLFISPCRPKFMPGYSQQDKQNVIQDLVDDATGNIVNNLLPMKIGGMYYSVEFAYSEYYSYLNKMIRSIAGYMGLGDTEVNLTGKGASDRKPLKHINWGQVNRATNNVFSSGESIVFFVDGLNTIDTSFSNDTRQSSIAGTVNGYSDVSNEVQFLIGDSKVYDFLEGSVDVASTITSGIGNVLQGFAGGLIGALGNTGCESVLNGGKIIFPEIWSDSEHSESYQFTVKLRSPDNDSLSILLNVLVPYCKILAMTMAKTIDGNPNGYKSPFLVKAYCKGLFSIDMGIIDSLQVTKGAECMWNDDGLPTQIDLSFSIKNLYNNLAMTGSDDELKYLLANTAYMDFLANMAGCNVMKANYLPEGKIDTALYEFGSRLSLTNAIGNLYNNFSNNISNTIGKIYGYI